MKEVRSMSRSRVVAPKLGNHGVNARTSEFFGTHVFVSTTSLKRSSWQYVRGLKKSLREYWHVFIKRYLQIGLLQHGL